MKGRIPKPTAQKVREGNPGGRKLNEQEPKAKVGCPEIPADLTDAAKRVWDITVPVLLGLKTLTVADGDALAAYCEAKVMHQLAIKEVEKFGITLISAMGPKKNPAVTVVNESLKAMRSFMAEFGMNPSARARLKVGGEEKESALATLLKARQASKIVPIA